MFDKIKLKRQLSEKKRLILELEQKRTRSESSILEAILSHQDPSDEDTEYFNRYTTQINQLREEIHVLQKQIGVNK